VIHLSLGRTRGGATEQRRARRLGTPRLSRTHRRPHSRAGPGEAAAPPRTGSPQPALRCTDLGHAAAGLLRPDPEALHVRIRLRDGPEDLALRGGGADPLPATGAPVPATRTADPRAAAHRRQRPGIEAGTDVGPRGARGQTEEPGR
jgi:hypothetical protein